MIAPVGRAGRGAILISIVVTTVARDHRRGDRRRRARRSPRRREPQRLEPQRARRGPTRSSTRPTSALLGEFNLFGSFADVGVVDRGAARLHADAGRLLRHDGHDDRDRRRGRPARRGGHARRTPSGSWSSTRSPRPPVAPPASRSNTSYIESASGVGEGARTGLASRGHRRAVPARDLPRAAGRRSSRARPPSRRWSWSAS